MIDQAQTNKLKDILALSKNALIVFPEEENLDLFLATYCLHSFLAARQDVRLLTPKFKQKIPTQLNDFIDIKLIEHELGKENLLISFPYKEEQVDKVSYYIGEQDKRFYLTIKPKKGVAPLDSSALEFSYAGAQADLLILCGVEDLEKLNQLYFAYENLYKGIDNHLVTINNFIPDFGNLNLDISPCNSYCEAVFYLFKDMGRENDDFLAKSNLPTLLLYGIEEKNLGLQASNTSPNTFLTVAELLQLGAMRLFKLDTKRVSSASNKAKSKVISRPQIHAIK